MDTDSGGSTVENTDLEAGMDESQKLWSTVGTHELQRKLKL